MCQALQSLQCCITTLRTGHWSKVMKPRDPIMRRYCLSNESRWYLAHVEWNPLMRFCQLVCKCSSDLHHTLLEITLGRITFDENISMAFLQDHSFSSPLATEILQYCTTILMFKRIASPVPAGALTLPGARAHVETIMYHSKTSDTPGHTRNKVVLFGLPKFP